MSKLSQSVCQVCGNPMYYPSYHGTDENGSLNSAFCSNCYKGGKFYSSSLNTYTSEDVFTADAGYSEVYTSFLGKGFGFYAANKK